MEMGSGSVLESNGELRKITSCLSLVRLEGGWEA